LEYAQERVGAGPGIDCVRTGRSVAVGDLADDHPYPRLWDFLTAEKSQVPFRAVLSVPVVVGDEVAGTFNVMSTGPWQWKSGQAEAVEAYAAVIAVLLRLGVAAQQRSVPFRPRLRDEDD
jgi:GAF domain-containing protein